MVDVASLCSGLPDATDSVPSCQSSPHTCSHSDESLLDNRSYSQNSHGLFMRTDHLSGPVLSNSSAVMASKCSFDQAVPSCRTSACALSDYDEALSDGSFSDYDSLHSAGEKSSPLDAGYIPKALTGSMSHKHITGSSTHHAGSCAVHSNDGNNCLPDLRPMSVILPGHDASLSAETHKHHRPCEIMENTTDKYGHRHSNEMQTNSSSEGDCILVDSVAVDDDHSTVGGKVSAWSKRHKRRNHQKSSFITPDLYTHDSDSSAGSVLCNDDDVLPDLRPVTSILLTPSSPAPAAGGGGGGGGGDSQQKYTSTAQWHGKSQLKNDRHKCKIRCRSNRTQQEYCNKNIGVKQKPEDCYVRKREGGTQPLENMHKQQKPMKDCSTPVTREPKPLRKVRVSKRRRMSGKYSPTTDHAKNSPFVTSQESKLVQFAMNNHEEILSYVSRHTLATKQRPRVTATCTPQHLRELDPGLYRQCVTLCNVRPREIDSLLSYISRLFRPYLAGLGMHNIIAIVQRFEDITFFVVEKYVEHYKANMCSQRQ